MARTKRLTPLTSTDQVSTVMNLMAKASRWKTPEPPIALCPRARAVFDDCVTKRSIEQQMATPATDWWLMASMAKSVVLLADLHTQISEQGTIMEDPKGKMVSHPAFTQIDQLTRSIQATTRSLQLSSQAILGNADQSRDRRGRTAAVEKAATTDYDDLLA